MLVCLVCYVRITPSICLSSEASKQSTQTPKFLAAEFLDSSSSSGCSEDRIEISCGGDKQPGTVEPTGPAPSLRLRNGRRHGAGCRAQRPHNGGLCGPHPPTPSAAASAAAAPPRSCTMRVQQVARALPSLRAPSAPPTRHRWAARNAGGARHLSPPPPALLRGSAAAPWSRSAGHGRLRAADHDDKD